MDIASAEETDTHVIWVTDYHILEAAIKKAVNTKIGTKSIKISISYY